MSAPDKDQRTHAPTPKRIREFRKRGDIARSRDVTTTATLAGGLIACVVASGPMWRAIETLMRRALHGAGTADPALPAVAARSFAMACLPAAAGALAGYALASAWQLGWPPVFTFPKLNLGRVVSAESIKNIFAPAAMARRALLSTAKVAFVGYAGYLAVEAELHRFLRQPALEPGALGARAVSGTARLVQYAGLALAVLAAVDYLWQRRDLMGRMRMTLDEVKRENKEQEGDPHIRRERRRRQRELARRRLPAQVKQADVVVVNPTHFAVALRYRADEHNAPVVVAKGRGPVAQRIRDIARNAQIPILSRPPLARLIYRLVPEGREIPAQLYQAVAEVLAVVYRIRARRFAS